MRRILLVSDDEPIAALFAEGLTTSGCQVEVIADGPEAVDRVVDGGFDLIVIDVGLPGGAALGVVRVLHQADVAASVLVLSKRDTVRRALVDPDCRCR